MSAREILSAYERGALSKDEALKALYRLKNASAPREQPAAPAEGGIAVIGMAGRFPGASNLEEFWRKLEAGTDCVEQIPESRWALDATARNVSSRKETESRRWAGLLEGIEHFDPLFFGISPKEASYMDPQQRSFLEVAWSAMEDAAYSPERLSGMECGVFVGVGPGDYQQKLHAETRSGEAYALLGNTSSILTGRLAYVLNLKGPSIAIDTACSSSLVAIHQACLSLRVGECNMAVAGGVSVITTPQTHIMTSTAGMLSPTGKCRAFDNNADGFVASEGVGVIVLKRVEDAIRDGDPVYGVILASRTNQDGSTNGITAPSAESQKKLLVDVYRKSSIHPSTIDYVECHGTGTKLGDPIELDALTQAFREFTRDRQFCAIGSVKANIGHCLAAAGVASVIKVLLSLKHRKIPASLHFDTPNEHIRFADSPFFVNTKLSSWSARNGRKRRAAVSSFGFSGTNAHLVIEELEPVARATSIDSSAEPAVVVPLSAASTQSLKEYAGRLLEHLERTNGLNVRDIAYTLQVGRRAMESRVCFVVCTVAELCAALKRVIDALELSRSADPICMTSAAAEEESMGPDWSSIRKLLRLAGDWMKGGTVDWDALYGATRPQRISLPTYPFSKVRCWFDQAEGPPSRQRQVELAPPPDGGEGNRKSETSRADGGVEAVTQTIRKLLASTLYLDAAAIPEDRDLLTIGVDSITGLEWIREINREFNVSLEASSIYSHPTLRAMGELIHQQLRPDGAATAGAASEERTAAAPESGAAPGRSVAGASRRRSLDVAVIGLAGRYAMAGNLEELWENLKSGRNCISEIPPNRWNHEPYFSPERNRVGKTYSKWGGFIDDVDKFDAGLFNIVPRDAVMLDPQVRLFMQTTGEAIENAGYCDRELREYTVGVFVGSMYDHYPLLSKDREKGAIMAATTSWSIPNRTSYFFGFRGPSLSINTACSSSLTAIYLACESIANEDCDYAIAGGVNLSLHHSKWLALSYGGVIGGSNKSMSLGKGDGYIPGEGVGAVLLKPLDLAIASNDHIHGVIKGGCINHGGRSKAFSVPSVEAQSALIRHALEKADVSADTIGYVETAANGSVLGDPVEIRSLSTVLAGTKRKIPIGSIKSNIGHLEAASGVSQLTKVLLQFQHEMLVPSINSEPLNEAINLDESPFYVQREVASWKSSAARQEAGDGTHVRRAMINSFGAGGANAHLIVEESPVAAMAAEAAAEDGSYYIFLLSTLYPEGLQEYIRRFGKYCEGEVFRQARLKDVAYTLQVGRCDLDYRVAIVARDADELRTKLSALAAGTKQIDDVYEGLVRNSRDKSDGFDIEAAAGDTIFTRTTARLMARRWVGGARIRWRSFYTTSLPHRVPLPACPFKNERYWVTDNETGVTEASESGAASEAPVNSAVAPPAAAPTAQDAKDVLCGYIASIIAVKLNMQGQRLDRLASFNSYGMDSIMVAEITAELETDFGRLSKTLFFQYANIDELADYFLAGHKQAIERILARSRREEAPASGRSEPAARVADQHGADASLFSDPRFELKNDAASGEGEEGQAAGERHYQDVYLLNFWRYRFTSKGGKGSLSVLSDERALYASGYKGVIDDEPRVLHELNELAKSRGYHVCYWAPVGPHTVAIESSNDWISVPVAVWQTITGLKSFDLEGGKRRKLRYAVNHFLRSGSNRVTEYHDVDPGVNREIAEVIYEWAKTKKYVNSVDAALRDIKTSGWQKKYRIFLTYRDEQLQNVIFIIRLSDQGYLMEQEYYRQSMPFGGTEYAVVEILKTLAAEGCDTFSLGLTWAIDPDAYCSDALGQQLMQETIAKDTFLSRIYEAGKANQQYKSKFGVSNTSVNLYRPAQSDPRIIIEFLSQFFAHGVSHKDLEATLDRKGNADAGSQESPPGDEAASGDRAHTTPGSHDLESDSWSYSRARNVSSRIATLIGRIDADVDYTKLVAEVLGCSHLHLTCSGRAAESLFFRALKAGAPATATRVLGSIFFETTAHNLSSNGYLPVELPHRDILDRNAAPFFIGGLDRAAIEKELERDAASVAMLFVELCNNGCGGYPVSMDELKWLREMATRYQTELVMDVTRIVTNATLISRHEESYAGKSVWEIVREIVQLADYAVGSLSKDFCVSTGGIICARNPRITDRVEKYAQLEGGSAGALDKGVIGESLREPKVIEENVVRRIAQVGKLGSALEAAGIPVLNRSVAHCILIPINALERFASLEYPRRAFLKWLRETAGIRGSVHSIGGGRSSALQWCVRLAVPLGMSDEEHERMLARVSEFRVKTEHPAHEERASRDRPSGPSAGDIAIIGMSGRFPNAANVAELWENIRNGATCVSAIPEGRFERMGRGLASTSSGGRIRWGGFMSGVDRFDPLFFGISPAEAGRIDPQQRLILQTAWEAIEDAGYTRAALSTSKTGVFVAIPLAEYLPYDPVTGFGGSIASNRISHQFDLVGPSEIFQTCCSSSFVALHRAIQSISAGECETAIVGGVQVLMNAAEFEAAHRAGLLSKGAMARSFDQSADGYVRSECVGAILIKPFDAALRDHDNIYAVVKGTGVCHGGTGLSITAPSVTGIREAMMQAYRRNNIDPRTVQYIEAHGISSPLGDAVEIEALRQGYRQLEQQCDAGRPRTPCYIGSAKPNFGHAEFASGMLALFKVILAMRSRVIPGITGFRKLNETISLEGSPFVISAENREWEAIRDASGAILPRRASLSSFGLTGVNAHVVIEEYVERSSQTATGRYAGPHLFVLSARNEDDLRRYVHNFVGYLGSRERSPAELHEIAHTLAVGREAMTHRLAIVHSTTGDLLQWLNVFLETADAQSRREHSVFAGTAAEARELRASADGAHDDRAEDLRNLREVAQRWVDGQHIDWTRLYGADVKRVSLPTYPFHGECYWPESREEGQPPMPAIEGHEPRASAVLAAKERADADQIEAAVLDTVSTVTKIDQQALSPKLKLKGIGVDSLMLVKVAASLESRVGLRLGQNDLAGAVTLRDLTAAVVAGLNERRAGSRVDLPCNEVELLQSGADLDPAFWIHGGFGTTQFYNPLARRIEAGAPVYAIKARGISDEVAPLTDMTDIARHYNTLVAGICGSRSVHLVGYSQGGIIAYEMARQMQLEGRSINSLVLLDAPFPDLQTKLSVQEEYLLVLMNLLYMQGVTIAPEALDPALTECSEELIVDRLVQLGATFPIRYSIEELRDRLLKYYRISEANERSVVNYRIERLPDPQAIHCVYFARKDRNVFFDPAVFPFRGAAEANRYFFANDCMSRWKSWIPTLEVHETDARDHFSLLENQSSIGLIARELNRHYAKALTQARAKRAG